MAKCPVCGMMADENGPSFEYQGKTYYFHTPEHKDMFEKDPEKFLARDDMESGHDMQM